MSETAKLTGYIRFTKIDGTVQEVPANFEFTTDDEAEDMYETIVTAVATAGFDERKKKRGKGQGATK